VAGNGARLVTTPNPPTNVRNDILVTSANQIGIIWDDGAYDGGQPITDYKILYEQGDGVYTVLFENVIERRYTLFGVTTGITYSFKVSAHNSEGYSAYS